MKKKVMKKLNFYDNKLLTIIVIFVIIKVVKFGADLLLPNNACPCAYMGSTLLINT